MQVNNMLINNYNYNCPLMNNYYYQQLYQQNMKQQLYQQYMIYNINYTNINYIINQENFINQKKNNFQNYQNSLYNKPNYIYKKQNNKISNIKPGKKLFNGNKSNYIEEKEENKIFNLTNRRRKSSISTDRTTRCDSSFNNSILSEDEKELKKEEGKKQTSKKSLLINLSKKNPNYKKKLSNISEASESSKNSNDNDNNSEDDNKDLENSFFSDEEIDDKDENKIENGKKFEKSGKFGIKETQGIHGLQGKKFENEKIFFENEKFEKKVEKNANENNISYKKKEYVGNPALENIEVLRVNVKLEGGKNAVFKLKRYDDVFETIKLFCEINSVDEQLIKPLIIKSLSTLNTIYQIMNSKVDEEQIEIMKNIKKEMI